MIMREPQLKHNRHRNVVLEGLEKRGREGRREVKRRESTILIFSNLERESPSQNENF